MPSTWFSHLTKSELKAACWTRRNAAAKLKKRITPASEPSTRHPSELLAIEFELRRIQKILGVKIIWREKQSVNRMIAPYRDGDLRVSSDRSLRDCNKWFGEAHAEDEPSHFCVLSSDFG